MKMTLDYITLIAIICWFPMCLASVFALTAHGVYEKGMIKVGFILSYPMVIFFIYYYVNANFFSYLPKTALAWSLIAGVPVLLILLEAIKSLLKSTYVDAVLFAPLNGVLSFEGKPAAGAKVTRWIRLRDVMV